MLRLDLIEDGPELGRITRQQVLQNQPQSDFKEITYRLANIKPLIATFGSAGLLMAVAGAWMASTSPDPWASAATIAILEIIYLAQAAFEFSAFAKITTTELTFGTLKRRWKVPLADIAKVTIDDQIYIFTDKTTYWLPTRLDNPDQIVLHLQAWTQAREIPQISKDKSEPLTFKPGPGFYCSHFGSRHFSSPRPWAD